MEDMLTVFWDKGYDATSIEDLELVTGVKRQSLYRAFGDKRDMYIAALRQYAQTAIAEIAELLDKGDTAEKRIQTLIKHVLRTGDRRGCFLCNASIDQAPHDMETDELVRQSFVRLERIFANALAVSAPYERDKVMRRRMARKLLTGFFGLRVLQKAALPLATLNDAASLIIAEI